jgi:hypothetical protein
MDFEEIIYVEKLKETLELLKNFRDELGDTTLGGVSCDNLSQDLWDMLNTSIGNVEKIIIKNNKN